MKNILIALMLLSLSLSYGQMKVKKMNPSAYLEWYNSNDFSLKDTVIIENVFYICEYVPFEAEICQQILKNEISLKNAKISLKQEIEPKFILRVFYDNSIHTEKDMSYLSFGIKKQFTLTEATIKDTLNCIGYHLERGISELKRVSFSIYFELEKKENLKELTFIFTDDYFSNETIRFQFNVNKVPKLVL